VIVGHEIRGDVAVPQWLKSLYPQQQQRERDPSNKYFLFPQQWAKQGNVDQPKTAHLHPLLPL
jgi:hypothetical protein